LQEHFTEEHLHVQNGKTVEIIQCMVNMSTTEMSSICNLAIILEDGRPCINTYTTCEELKILWNYSSAEWRKAFKPYEKLHKLSKNIL